MLVVMVNVELLTAETEALCRSASFQGPWIFAATHAEYGVLPSFESEAHPTVERKSLAVLLAALSSDPANAPSQASAKQEGNAGDSKK